MDAQKMSIATWNLERLQKGKNQHILNKLVEINADILVLTETNSIIQLDNYTSISTDLLPTEFEGIKYRVGENRVSILTKYKTTTRHNTFDSYSAICSDMETPFGLLTVYGSIIGVFGNRQPRFDSDLNGLLADFEKIVPCRQVCFAGDLNVTFSGRPWPSKKARQTLMDTFKEHRLANTTANITDTVDHIVLSSDFLDNKYLEIETWNADKELSDHVGHVLRITL